MIQAHNEAITGWKNGDFAWMYHRGLSLWRVRLLTDVYPNGCAVVASVNIPAMQWLMHVDHFYEELPEGSENTPGFPHSELQEKGAEQ